jgi:predicted ATPase
MAEDVEPVIEPPFLRSVLLVRERIEDPEAYPFSLPAVQALDGLALSAVTYFIGENGSGKSTILEALAVAMGFNAEGGSVNFNFATRRSESPLHRCIRIARTHKPRTGFFLRAESFYNVATEIERLGVDGYGDRSPHEQSHGESFLALMKNRFGPRGLYILDEPEAALSPSRQLSLLVRMRDLVEEGSQFIIATHAPIVLAYPGATIYLLDESGISRVEYDRTEHVSLTRDFLNDRERFLKRLFATPTDEGRGGR